MSRYGSGRVAYQEQTYVYTPIRMKLPQLIVYQLGMQSTVKNYNQIVPQTCEPLQIYKLTNATERKVSSSIKYL